MRHIRDNHNDGYYLPPLMTGGDGNVRLKDCIERGYVIKKNGIPVIGACVECGNKAVQFYDARNKDNHFCGKACFAKHLEENE